MKLKLSMQQMLDVEQIIMQQMSKSD